MSLASARRAVVDACLVLADRGYLAGVGGNLALKVDEQHFAVTPSGADYYSMRPDDVVVLTIDGLDPVAGEKRPSVESGLHARVFLGRHDVRASVHTHQPVASAVALLGVPIPLTGALGAVLGERVELVSYAPSGTSLLARALARRLEPDINGYLLANHGLLCVGPTLEAAIERVELVELAAARFLEGVLGSRDEPSLAFLRQSWSRKKARSP
jgi:L-fuculose-phosphate aldolase